jgi:hypothetical protein
MQDEINEKSLSIGVRIGEITATELKKVTDKLLEEMKSQATKNVKALTSRTSEPKHGKQTLKSLASHNAGLTSIELKDPNQQLLYREMKRNGVDFAALKDGKRQYTLFFKSRDADALTHALQSYTKKLTERAARPSIASTLAAAKQAAKTLAANLDKVKNKDKGAPEL